MAPSTTSRGTLYGALGAGAALAGALTYVGIGNPHSTHFGFPPCPFQTLTGWYCPACGGLRMTHDLLHGDFASAFVDNVFLLVGLPALAIWLLIRWRRGLSLMPKPAVIVLVIAATTWTVVRNLPGFPLVPTLIGG